MKAKATMTEESKRSYNSTLKRFQKFCDDKNINIINASESDVSMYMNQFKDHKIKTRKSYKIILNGFYNWLIKNGYTQRNPVEDITIKGNASKNDKEDMTQNHFQRILNNCSGVRDMALISFLWYTGVRAKELTSIRVSDINVDQNYIFVGLSKSESGNRRIPIHPNFKKLLGIYLRKRINIDTDFEVLFLTKHNKKIKYRTLLSYIKDLQKGTDYDFAVHDFRRAFVTRLYDKTGDIVLCQQLAGHSSIETTRKYIQGNQKRLEKFSAINF